MPRGHARSKSRDRNRRGSGSGSSRRARSQDDSKRHHHNERRHRDRDRDRESTSSRREDRHRKSSSRRSSSRKHSSSSSRRKHNKDKDTKTSSGKESVMTDSQRIAAQLAIGAGVGAAILAPHIQQYQPQIPVVTSAAAAAIARLSALSAPQPAYSSHLAVPTKSVASMSALAALSGGGGNVCPPSTAPVPCPTTQAPTPAVPATTSAASIEHQQRQLRLEEERETLRRQQEFLEHERMQEQLAAEQEKQQEAQLLVERQARAVAAAGKSDEVDELDKFMMSQEELAQQELREALQREHEDKLTFLTGGSVQDDDADTAFSSTDSSKHCYICKQTGHTKGDCPQKRCPYCTERGHIQIECPAWLEHNAKREAEEKARKRKRQKELAKAKKKQLEIHQLRMDSGVYGYKELYLLLGLPDNKLAPMGVIKKAFQKQSLTWHPDKWANKSEKEQADAADHYSKIREGYDVLLEGLEKGFAGGGALVSGGDIAGTSH